VDTVLNASGLALYSRIVFSYLYPLPPLLKVLQNVDILRGIFARMFGLSDLQIQTAGQSATTGFSLLSSSEGRLPGLDIQTAEKLKDELIKRAKGKQGV